MKNCIVCESKEISVFQKIQKKELVELYFDHFNFDISKELNEEFLFYYKCSNCKTRFFNPKFAGSAMFYEQLQKNRSQYYNPNRKEFFFAKNFIRKNDSVLEIGAGSGLFAKLIKSKDYLGLEFNELAIRTAEKQGVKLLKEDVVSFSEKNKEKYDVVCFFHVLEHVKNPNDFIKSSLKCLKKGGKLIISVPCNDSIYTNNINHVLNLPPHHLSRFFVKTLSKFDSIFNLDVVAYQLDFVGDKINKKNYLSEYFTHKILFLLKPKNKLLLNKNYFIKTKNLIHKFNNKFKLYKLYKNSIVEGENMTFIYLKK